MFEMKNVLSAVELLSLHHPDSWDRFVVLLGKDRLVIYFRKCLCSLGTRVLLDEVP